MSGRGHAGPGDARSDAVPRPTVPGDAVAPCGPPIDLEAFARALEAPAARPEASWRPVFVRLEPGRLGALAALCRANRLELVDAIDRQLRDLAAVRLPAAERAGEREGFIEAIVAARGDRAAVGAWVHLPWDRRVVHVLDEADYVAVITSRNQDKITSEEQKLLRAKKIGVMGLSVGGEAAVTVAQEHLCGEIVLADFDRLDLSNLNRLNAGIDELGHNKAVIVARRIVRIDPYLRIRIFEEGVTEANAAAFLEGLDLLIEEVDGLRVKHVVRELARERGLDIVFAGDERGFLSIEPYASFPDLAPFHGRIAEPPQPREAYPTALDFMRALTEWLGGWDAISERSRGSLERIGRSLCGYPQLAEEARYAAGQIGHAARRLLLGERLPPFIGNLDLADTLPAAPEPRPAAHARHGGPAESGAPAASGPTPS